MVILPVKLSPTSNDDVKKIEIADLIIVGVKAWQVTDVARNIKIMVGSNATTSLQRDITNAKPSELESWDGAFVRLDQQSSVATPLSIFIYNTLLPLELQAREKLKT